MEYQDALKYILSFTDYERETRYVYSPANFDLRRVEALLSRLGNPHLRAKTVHIAGTKGKGSTAAMIYSILRSAGYHVGLFTSPHLLSFCERIRVDGALIPEQRVGEIVERMKPEIEAVLAEEDSFGRLTTFELIAALAFAFFAEEEADLQVIETGLGGRLDATNVVRPVVSVITSISLDHTSILGDTIAKIAAEKSGIIKPGSMTVMAPQVPEAAAVIAATCRDKDSRLLRVGTDVTWRSGVKRFDGQSLTIDGLLATYEAWIPLIGEHQQENASTAVAAIEGLKMAGIDISATTVVAGLGQTSWPGRLQIVETIEGRPLVVIDGAHNDDSARRLRQAVQEHFGFYRVILIIGTSSDKNIDGIVRELAPLAAMAFIVRSSHPRAAETSAIIPLFEAHGVEASAAASIESALNEAKAVASPGDLILATGSLFVVAEILAAYGLRVV